MMKSSKVSAQRVRRFQQKIWRWYGSHRRDLPWRNTANPYRIVVSEIMLQQTQVHRVEPKYRTFLRQFPSWRRLARAELGEVLKVWQGLGYNRRAKALHRMAQEVLDRFKGRLPEFREELLSLPGIGDYTAAAIGAFVYQRVEPVIETNIRAVYLHEFCSPKERPTDQELLHYIVATADARNPREWFYALMDYGATLKRANRGIGQRSAHYQRQTPFRGSRREVRGFVIRLLTQRQTLSTRELKSRLPKRLGEVRGVLDELLVEGLIKRTAGRYSL